MKSLVPLYDIHFGSEETDEDYFDSAIRYIHKHSNCRTFLGGDILECAIYGSKGSVHSQKFQVQEQLEIVAEKLHPIRNKILFSLYGNHEYRVEKATGLNVSKILADMIDVEYAGFEKQFLFEGFRCYAHHGTGAGGTSGSRVNSLERLHFRSPFANVIFAGHSHFPVNTEKEIRYLDSKGRIKSFIQYFISCGSTHGSDGYAAQKGLQPVPTSIQIIEFGKQINVRKLRLSESE